MADPIDGQAAMHYYGRTSRRAPIFFRVLVESVKEVA